ncbi:cysteine-rich repeat secretory protein 11-like [Canna indica]|uniref:Cysteine-rich repeat secretory protein 11-like n=1 Tax=Canna indica TaxID=4628 RepID=A0AAQ3Q7T1_9LILI|nr:cysteine-rich repeat secretory protein 11-like [Canna indica]
MGIPKAHHLLASPLPPPPSSPSPFPLLTLSAALTLLSLSLLPPPTTAADLYNLVYKGCANQSLSGGATAYSQTLATLSSSLAAQASTSKFYKTTTSNSYGGQSLFGLFQCRGDLSPSDCSSCVGRLLPMWSSLCGAAAAARIQLTGCYALYQVSGFPQVSGTQMLYKTCGSGGGGGNFEVKRDTAFAQLQTGVSGGKGFYATSYGSVYTMAQCEGDLSTSDCSDCVAQAVQKSEVECGGAASGQVYLDKCYISYSYYANGVATSGSGGGGGGGGVGGQTGKTVAIVVGGAAGVGFLIICLLFARSVLKKKDGEYLKFLKLVNEGLFCTLYFLKDNDLSSGNGRLLFKRWWIGWDAVEDFGCLLYACGLYQQLKEGSKIMGWIQSGFSAGDAVFHHVYAPT